MNGALMVKTTGESVKINSPKELNWTFCEKEL